MACARGWIYPPSIPQRGGVAQSFVDLALKESASPFPLYINAHSSQPCGREPSQLWVGVAEGIHTQAHGPLRSKYSATACIKDVGWGRKKNHLLVWAQQEPTHSSSCCACGLLASLLAFLPPEFVSFQFLLVYQSLLVSTRFGRAQSPAGPVALHGGFAFAGCRGWWCNGVPSVSSPNSLTTPLFLPQVT